MVVAQVGLSITLLSSSAVVMRGFERLLRVDPGFSPGGVLTFLVRTPPEFYPDIADAIAFQDRLQRDLSRLPGVIAASAAAVLPLSSTAPQTTVAIAGSMAHAAACDSCRSVLVDVVPVRAGYVEAMQMRLVAGRTFHSPRRRGVFEALIDQSLAKRAFANTNPLGATIPYTGRLLTVVGVVQQARLYDVDRNGRSQLIVRAEDFEYRPLYYVARTAGDPRSFVPDVRSAVRRLDGRVAVGNIRALDDIVNDSLHRQRTGAILIAALALGAVLLTGMGLFAIVVGAVTQRRHELAVRLALGATPEGGVRLVFREGALLVGIGVLIALPGVYVAGRVVHDVVPTVSPWDSLTLLAVTVSLGIVTLTTCYLPARRALNIYPGQLLREES